MTIDKCGQFYVLSAPSGSGKSTVKESTLQKLPDLVYSVSFTTRQPRPGEVDGRDYNFINEAQFKAMIESGLFLEWAEVFGKYYGTGRSWVAERLAAGKNVLADLDVVGAASVRKIMPEATLIFMVPPTMEELRRRLFDRGTEKPEELECRLGEAVTEISKRGLFDFLLVNDELDLAVTGLVNIIRFGQGRPMAESRLFWPDFFVPKGVN